MIRSFQQTRENVVRHVRPGLVCSTTIGNSVFIYVSLDRLKPADLAVRDHTRENLGLDNRGI